MREKIELFNELNKHLMEDDAPSKFMNKISIDPMFLEYPFALLSDLKNAKQSPQHHPEGNVWNHTLDGGARHCEQKNTVPGTTLCVIICIGYTSFFYKRIETEG